MRFNNKNEIKIIPPIYIVLVAVFLTNIFVNIELIGQDEPIKFSHFVPNIVTFLIFLFVHKIGVSFDFDSDGETLIFKNNGVFFSKFMEYRVRKSRRRRGFKKYTFNTTFLSRKKKRGLVASLQSILDKPKAVA